jgi:F0F1-type ATP synthase membrane subunit a
MRVTLMFIMHISSLLALTVVLGSTILLIWSLRNRGVGSALGTVVGFATLALSLLSFMCIGYYGIKYWSQGEFETSMPMKKMHQEMMEKMMGHMGNVEHMAPADDKSVQSHPHHH